MKPVCTLPLQILIMYTRLNSIIIIINTKTQYLLTVENLIQMKYERDYGRGSQQRTGQSYCSQLGGLVFPTEATPEGGTRLNFVLRVVLGPTSSSSLPLLSYCCRWFCSTKATTYIPGKTCILVIIYTYIHRL